MLLTSGRKGVIWIDGFVCSYKEQTQLKEVGKGEKIPYYKNNFHISKFDIPIWEEKKIKANIFETVLRRKWIVKLKLLS